MAMEGLGRSHNVVVEANDVYINLKDYGGVTFYGFEDGGNTTFTITTATAVSGGTTATGDIITRYYTSNGVGGVWTERTQTAAETVEPDDDATQDCVAVYVSAAMLPDGHKYVKMARDQAAGTGPTVVAVLDDLAVQRDPANLASPIV